jgi:high-affinity iron transporter
MSALRTAHEAQWLTIGQGRVADLSWLAPNGSVQAALLVGVLGVRPDPRVVEVLGWALYAIPLLAFTLWPAKRRLKGAQVPRLQLGLAAGLAVVGLGLAVAVPSAASAAPGGAMAVVDDGRSIGTARGEGGALVLDAGGTTTRFTLDAPAAQSHAGVDATRWTLRATGTDLPTTLDLATLVALSGGRMPVGLDPKSAPGPFDARWNRTGSGTAWTADDRLLDARQADDAVVTISGGGLATPRTIGLAATPGTPGVPGSWQVSPAAVTAAAHQLAAADRAAADRALWRTWLPLVLLVAAAALAAAGLRRRRGLRAAPAPSSVPSSASSPAPAPAPAGALAADA